MSYRLIDSNAIAIKYPEVNEMPCVFANLPDGIHGQFIDAQPEIIRCRDCKLRDTEYCNMARGFMGMKDDDYCSYAERRWRRTND